jgi:hypothetical protein
MTIPYEAAAIGGAYLPSAEHDVFVTTPGRGRQPNGSLAGRTAMAHTTGAVYGHRRGSAARS